MIYHPDRFEATEVDVSFPGREFHGFHLIEYFCNTVPYLYTAYAERTEKNSFFADVVIPLREYQFLFPTAILRLRNLM